MRGSRVPATSPRCLLVGMPVRCHLLRQAVQARRSGNGADPGAVGAGAEAQAAATPAAGRPVKQSIGVFAEGQAPSVQQPEARGTEASQPALDDVAATPPRHARAGGRGAGAHSLQPVGAPVESHAAESRAASRPANQKQKASPQGSRTEAQPESQATEAFSIRLYCLRGQPRLLSSTCAGTSRRRSSSRPRRPLSWDTTPALRDGRGKGPRGWC